MNPADDVDTLLEHLKALPLIDGADLDRPFAAYDSFEVVLGAILRAALVQAPPEKRKGKNGPLFQAFVRDHFPGGRGRDDGRFAANLWLLRCLLVKEKRTGGQFRLTQGAPEAHLAAAADGRQMLDLESLIADFRAAVDDLGPILRASPELRSLAADEVGSRTVHVAAAASFTQSETAAVFRGTEAAKAASGTN